MKEEFVIKAIIPDVEIEGIYTIYMFNHERKVLLPIKTTKWECDALLLAKSNKSTLRPHTHDTLKRVILSLEARVEEVFVYKVLDEIFYSYIKLRTRLGVIDIDSRTTDALCIAIRFSAKINVDVSVYEAEGIVLTRELIEQSLTE